MTTDKEQDTLPVNLNGEAEMAVIRCSGCDLDHEIINNFVAHHGDGAAHQKDRIQGVFICGKCSNSNAFGMEGNVVVFVPGDLFTESLTANVGPDAQEMFGEALRCFYGSSYRGAIAMCRSAVAEGILGKQIGKRSDSLDALIKEAVSQNRLDSTDETKADYARLLGRGVVHRMLSVSGTEAMITLQSTAELLNTIARQ